MPKFSIITPTLNRESFLQTLYDCIKAQTIQDVEWLVHDGSPAASTILRGIADSDERVSYIHESKAMTIGAKRNALITQATGSYIVHMDDDDYYAPAYIESMLGLLTTRKADLVKLFGFFLHHRKSGHFAYWDLEHGFPLHYILHPHHAAMDVTLKPVTPKERWGYGFSYVYKREVWAANPFPDRDHGEDQDFIDAAVAGFVCDGMQDTQYLVVHVIHDGNTSIAYPQQILPASLGPICFKAFVP